MIRKFDAEGIRLLNWTELEEAHLLKNVMKNGGRSEIENKARHDEK